jgi:hypothetical protein
MIRGMEHAEDLVKAMDFERVRHVEESFGRFLDDFEAAIKSVTSPK